MVSFIEGTFLVLLIEGTRIVLFIEGTFVVLFIEGTSGFVYRGTFVLFLLNSSLRF